MYTNYSLVLWSFVSFHFGDVVWCNTVCWAAVFVRWGMQKAWTSFISDAYNIWSIVYILFAVFLPFFQLHFAFCFSAVRHSAFKMLLLLAIIRKKNEFVSFYFFQIKNFPICWLQSLKKKVFVQSFKFLWRNGNAKFLFTSKKKNELNQMWWCKECWKKNYNQRENF